MKFHLEITKDKEMTTFLYVLSDHPTYIYIFISLLYNFSDVLVSEMILVGIAVEVCMSLIYIEKPHWRKRFVLFTESNIQIYGM